MNSTNRYHRQMILPLWGEIGQMSLASHSVLVVGAGGLGATILSILSGVGFKKLGVADGDNVSIENLHRQILYNESHVGKNKAVIACELLSARNQETTFIAFPKYLNTSNAEELNAFDIVVDATDRFTSRYFLNDACLFYKKTLVHGSIYKNEGHVATFIYGASNYRDLFPKPPPNDLAPDCSIAGVSPAFCSVVASWMAEEVIHIGMNRPRLIGKLLVVNSDSFQMNVFNSSGLFDERNKDLPILRSEEYVDFCDGLEPKKNILMVNEISVQDLKGMQNRGEPFTLIDVRESDEFDIAEMGGTLIPLSEFQDRWQEVPKDGKVIIHCRAGMRSANAIRYLQEVHGYDNLFNLKGGILAWANEIDPTVKVY